jgi:hypothetical protein
LHSITVHIIKLHEQNGFLKNKLQYIFFFFLIFLPALEKGTELDILHNILLDTLFALPFPVHSDGRHILAKKETANKINSFRCGKERTNQPIEENFFLSMNLTIIVQKKRKMEEKRYG